MTTKLTRQPEHHKPSEPGDCPHFWKETRASATPPAHRSTARFERVARREA